MTEPQPAEFFIGFKTKLNPTLAQIQYFARACGVARFAYNWGLEEWKKQYAEHQECPECKPKPTETALRRLLKGTSVN